MMNNPYIFFSKIAAVWSPPHPICITLAVCRYAASVGTTR